MTFSRTVTSSLAGLALSAVPAVADISAEQAWDDVLQWIDTGLAEITFASEVRNGSTLTITGLQSTIALEEEVATSISIPVLTFTELGDGSVRMDFPDALTITSESDVDVPDTLVKLEMILAISDDQIILSGDDKVERYDYSIAEMGLSFGETELIGPDGPMPLPFDFAMTFLDSVGHYDIQAGDVRKIASESRIREIRFTADGEVDESVGDPGSLSMTGTIQNIVTASTGSFHNEIDVVGLADMIAAGFESSGTLTYGAVDYAAAISTVDGTFEQTGAVASGEMSFEFGPNGLALDTQSLNSSITIGGSQIPFPPMSFAMAESGFTLQFPLAPSSSPQAFAFGLRLIDFALPETLYNIFDPAAQLPREPATFEIDARGTALLTEDFTDPDFAEDPVPPGELISLNLNTLRLAMAGALLTGDASMEFNTGPDGIPMPVGAANFMLEGGNRLLDTLVAMGLVPQEQATGARLMLGLFARPGEGEDTLTSTLEMREDGAIFANGQRIR